MLPLTVITIFVGFLFYPISRLYLHFHLIFILIIIIILILIFLTIPIGIPVSEEQMRKQEKNGEQWREVERRH
jgi:uncharacterized membrane protein